MLSREMNVIKCLRVINSFNVELEPTFQEIIFVIFSRIYVTQSLMMTNIDIAEEDFGAHENHLSLKHTGLSDRICMMSKHECRVFEI
jgi:hypothetical protein